MPDAITSRRRGAAVRRPGQPLPAASALLAASSASLGALRLNGRTHYLVVLLGAAAILLIGIRQARRTGALVSIAVAVGATFLMVFGAAPLIALASPTVQQSADLRLAVMLASAGLIGCAAAVSLIFARNRTAGVLGLIGAVLTVLAAKYSMDAAIADLTENSEDWTSFSDGLAAGISAFLGCILSALAALLAVLLAVLRPGTNNTCSAL